MFKISAEYCSFYFGQTYVGIHHSYDREYYNNKPYVLLWVITSWWLDYCARSCHWHTHKHTHTMPVPHSHCWDRAAHERLRSECLRLDACASWKVERAQCVEDDDGGSTWVFLKTCCSCCSITAGPFPRTTIDDFVVGCIQYDGKLQRATYYMIPIHAVWNECVMKRYWSASICVSGQAKCSRTNNVHGGVGSITSRYVRQNVIDMLCANRRTDNVSLLFCITRVRR